MAHAWHSSRWGLYAVLMIVAAVAGIASGQQPATQPQPDSLISLNFPDNVDLKTVVDYVSQRLSLNIIYLDEQLSNQHVTIKSPTRIPVGALLGLLQNLLKVKGYAIVEGGQPGWMRIAPLQNSSAPATQPATGDRVLTQAFGLKFIDAQRADLAVKPFLSGPTAASLGISEQHILLVTDFASNLSRVEQMIDLIDQPNRNLRVEFMPVKNADAAQLAQQLKQILLAKVKAQALPGQTPENNVEVTQDRRTGQLVVVGPAALVDEAARVIKSLDVAVTEQQSPIRFYKLANATAADVLETIQALEGEPSSPEARQGPGGRQPSVLAPAVPTIAAPGSIGGLVLPGAAPGSSLANPYTESRQPQITLTQPPSSAAQPVNTETAGPAATPALHTKNATVAADANTNTIIVIAEPAVQKLYEQIIRTLDKRRPQVLIEATIVTLDTSHGFTFGVEVSGRSKSGKSQYVTFSNFGFSTPDPTTGRLALTPGVGFNGAVIGSDLAEVILRALATSSRAKVTSAPRILVNDNATGSLASLTEEPYTTTAIGTTIATTTFGGYAQAGTTVTLTPHISESDYLQLEYQVSLSSFTGTGSPTQGIPPGIEQDSVQSKVTIPDGSTVIVGGLNRTNYNRAVSSIPLLDQIPIVKYAFSRHDDSDEQVTLFVFLRPIILRDDQFEDLKFLSEHDLKEAGMPPGMPASDPIPIR